MYFDLLMLRITAALAFIMLFFPAYGQEKPVRNDNFLSILAKIFQTTKTYSVYKVNTDWAQLETEVLVKTDTAINFEEFRFRIQMLFSGIGDRHAAFYTKGMKIKMIDTSRPELRPSLIVQLRKNDLELHTRMLENEYGYLLVPGNNSKENIQRLGQFIQDSLCMLVKKDVKGIILDLRANEGGSIYPLFTGLHQIIGNSAFGAFTNIDGSVKDDWVLRKGKFIQRGRIVASVKPHCKIKKNMKVAVLTSQVTASAGEMLAIALKGRKNTIFIGEDTYGLTTGVATFRINGNTLALSTTLTEDRNGKRYAYVRPDIKIIEGDNFGDLSRDKKVQEAVEWFRQ